jgi:predicted ferric reductase
VAVVALCLLGAAGLMAAGYYLPETSTKVYWFVARSSGISAYLVITAGVVWGLVQSGASARARAWPGLALGLHSYLSWLGLGLTVLHAGVLLGDQYTHFTFVQVVMPFVADYRPLPVGLGIVGFYLMLLLSLSFYARPYINQKNFRRLHYAGFAAFALATLHGVLAGTDSGPLWWLYATSLVVVLLLTVARMAPALIRRETRAP